MIWIILFLTAITIIIVTIIQNFNQKKNYNNNLDNAFNMLSNAKSKYDNVSESILKLIQKEYGDICAENVSKGIITSNMPSELLVISWGKPEDIKTRLYKGEKTEHWFYDSCKDKLGNASYKTEVIIENNRITGWQNLN